MGNLYLLPSLLAPEGINHIPPIVAKTISGTRIFIVERIRTARRYIRLLHPDFPIDESTFIELDKHDLDRVFDDLKELFKGDHDIGLMSEAGTPCIADPGSRVVNLARRSGYQIRPMTGPSSIVLGLMASGMNGQQFSFHGYLPIKDLPLKEKLRKISNDIIKTNNTHIFIETPYRNTKIIEHIKKHIDGNLFLSAGINLNGKDEKIITNKISKWSSTWIDKTPTIFCVGKLVS